jgi:DNA-binding GntR family transcriptional regulator
MISRVSVTDQIYAALRQNIVQGFYAPGQRVVEAQVAKLFAVSRAPVREAVNRLLQEGLLEARTHHGPSVVHLTPAAMRDLYELRAAIESLAIRKIAIRAGTVNVAPLRDCVAKMETYASQGDLAGVVEAEMHFHQQLRELSGNSYVISMGHHLDGIVQTALTEDNKSYSSLHEVAEEHRPVIDAILQGDPEAAADILTRHILGSLHYLRVGRNSA